MGPYSLDLRARVVAAYHRGEGSIRDVAEWYQLAINTVENWLVLERTTGTVAPRPHGGGVRPTIRGDVLARLGQLVTEQPTATRPELHQALAHATQVHTSEAAVSRALKKLKVTRKKSHAGRRRRPARTSRHHGACSLIG